MAAPVIPSVSATSIADDVFSVSYLAQSAIPGGAVVCYNSGGSAPNDNDEVVLPGAASSGQIAGVSRSFGPYTSGVGGLAASGSDRVSVQKVGRAKVLLAAGATCNVGDIAVVANSSGHVQKRTQFSGSAGKVGKFAQAKTAGAAAELVEVDLELGDVELVLAQFQGFAATNSTNGTTYLSAPGTGAPSATAVLLGVVPPGGGTLRNLVGGSTTAPGAGQSDTYTVYRNPLVSGAYTGFAATTITCQVAGTANEAKDATHTVACNEGDLIAIAIVASATTAGAGRFAAVQLT